MKLAKRIAALENRLVTEPTTLFMPTARSSSFPAAATTW